MKGSTILLVDCDQEVLASLKARLEREGCRVICASDGEEALARFSECHPDLVLLELLLPQIDGYEVCRRIHQSSKVPVIILSSKGDEVDKAIGFRSGADDYVTKPFSVVELLLRIKAVMRRARCSILEISEPSTTIAAGALVLDRKRRVVTVGGEPVDLTAKEFELLWFLASNPEVVFSRDQILEELWSEDFDGDPKSVTVLVSRLRDKVEADPVNPRFVRTVWGVGYKFDADRTA